MQLEPGTAAELGCQDPLNPDDNLKAGTEYDAKILADLKVRFGPEIAEPDYFRFMLAGYNCGPGYVHVALKDCRARGVVLNFENFARALPTATVKGRKPDSKQALGYALKILPLGDTA